MTAVQSLQEKRAEVLRIAARYGAQNIRVFGSVARGDAQPESDIDLLVTFEEGRSLFDLIALSQELETVLNHKVDVVSEEALHWYIRDRVLQEAVAL
jgi:predicted nucleotidyltransferase